VSFQKTVENDKTFRDALWNFAGLHGKFNSCKLRSLVLDENATCNIHSSTIKLKQSQAAAADDHKKIPRGIFRRDSEISPSDWGVSSGLGIQTGLLCIGLVGLRQAVNPSSLPVPAICFPRPGLPVVASVLLCILILWYYSNENRELSW